MNTQRLSHIGICVKDLKKSADFYLEVFGYEEVGKLSMVPGYNQQADQLLDMKNCEFDALYIQRPKEDTRLELLCFKAPNYERDEAIRKVNLAGITHLSFRVESLDDTVELVKQSGGEYLSHTLVENPEFRVKSCMVTDLDGTRIELLQAPGDPDMLPG